jgi:3-hydroxybutyryl-CoA dehydrogenase
MRLFITGEQNRIAEFKTRFGDNAEADYAVYGTEKAETADLEEYDAIFDLNLDDYPENLDQYAHLQGKPVIVSAAKTQLAELAYFQEGEVACTLVGINALPTFLAREKAEISLFRKEEESKVKGLFTYLGWPCHIVEDRVGMVTPRIVFMIINEAHYTLQEGTATAADIDASMKLGTNYPLGPFEWLAKVGIQDVYETLDALYQDTRDERYKICPLLKTAYLRAEK